MLYMIIEEFRDGDALPAYRRLRDCGRQVPDGLAYINSWVTSEMKRCYQVMECDDRALLDDWMSRWADVVHFEVIPVITSSQAASNVASRL